MRSEDEVLEELNSALDAFRAQAPKLSASEKLDGKKAIKALRQELQEVLTEGAEPCDTCGLQPIGIHQPGSNQRLAYYEIGCASVCKNPNDATQHKRAIGLSRKNAVDNWNAGEYWLKG